MNRRMPDSSGLRTLRTTPRNPDYKENAVPTVPQEGSTRLVIVAQDSRKGTADTTNIYCDAPGLASAACRAAAAFRRLFRRRLWRTACLTSRVRPLGDLASP